MRRILCIVTMLACGLAAPIEARAGTLSVSFNSMPAGTIVNLTAEGTTDWVHWGLFTDTSIDRKANVMPRISNFAPVDASNGYVYIYQYSGDYAGYSWNDGTPHMTVTNTTTGVWAYGVPAIGSGFRFSVAASTNLQTLKVYVGAFAAEGRFVAFLSDGSAPNYTNGVNSAVDNLSNGPSAVYAINFAADSPGQTLTVVYTLKLPKGPGGGANNVTLQSAALSAPGMNNLPFVALTGPADGASFAQGDITLSANAGDSDGTVSVVEFYEGTNKIGEATTAPYSMVWLNPLPGAYVLTARARDNDGGVGTSSPVSVFVSGTGGSLSGLRNNSPASVNLTLEGTSDWAHWGAFNASSFNHKASGNSQISNFTLIGTNAVTRYDDNLTAFSWSDGTPLVSANGSTTGIYVAGVTNGFEISAPADTNMRTLRIYTGLYGAQAKFEAFLSDFSGRAFTDTSLSNVFGNRFVVYTIDYAAASPGQRLIVRQTIANVYDFAFGNVTLQAVTLQSATPPGNLAPTITITNPVNNAVFTAPATFTLEASASDNDGGVTQVEFFNGAAALGVDMTSPYSAVVNELSAGTYTLSAIATDNEGAKSTNSITITVNSIPVNNPPTVTITNPANGGIFTAPATFELQAMASDSDGAISQVEFLNGTISLGVDNSAPYAVTVSDLASGNYTLSAIATDDLGAKATNSVSIVVTNSSLEPVTITAPTVSGTTFSFTFATEADRIYTVERVASIPSTNWQTLTNIVGTGLNVTAQDSTTGAPQRFYRVLTQ
jgi:hypothetical protein